MKQKPKPKREQPVTFCVNLNCQMAHSCNAHTCQFCGEQTPAGKAAEMRRYLKNA